MMIDQYASAIGVHAGALRLLVSFLMAYGMGLIYRMALLKPNIKSPALRHIYHVACGFYLTYFNYGSESLHLIAAILIVWVILRIAGNSKAGFWAASIFAFAYLLYGYSFHMGEEYMIDWTTSYCVMCLRLIGLAADYYDGCLMTPRDEITKRTRSGSSPIILRPCSWDDAALGELPSLLETFGYCFYYGGCLVGPQFPFKIYQRFVTMESFQYRGKKGEALSIKVPKCGWQVARAFAIGGFYMMLSELGKIYFPPAYVISSDYAKLLTFPQRLFYMMIVGKVVLYRYLGVWSMNEGVCILSGLSFNGYHATTGTPIWDGLANVEPWLFDTATSLSQVIQSFNKNTNLWAKNYVYKRLKFLGSKVLSGFGTLMFLAIWHGFAPGYFAAFLVEFFEMEAERKLRTIFQPLLAYVYDRQTGWIPFSRRLIANVFLFLLTAACLAYGSITFDLLSWHNVKKFWHSNNYWAIFGVIIVFISDAVITQTKKYRRITDGLRNKQE